MQNKIQVFESSEFGKLEVMTIDGKEYFPAAACAKILGYSNPHKAVIDHCLEDGLTKREVIDSMGRLQQMKFITEGNLYRLIVRSKLPSAVRFEAWVMNEVLPSIRKYGAYISDDVLDQLIDNPESAVKLFAKLKDERTQMAALEGQVKRLTPKARYYDVILQCPGAVLTSVIAKDYGMTAVMFNRLLHALGVQFRYKTNPTWLLYKDYDNKGYTITNTYYYHGGRARILTCWTQKGRRFIYDLLAGHGILPQVEMIKNNEAAS